MNHDHDRDTSQPTDASKAQAAQEPQTSSSDTGQDKFQSDAGDQSTGQADYGSAEQADTLTQGRTDVEGASLGEDQTKSQTGGFVGSDSGQDTSSELVDDKSIPSDGE